MRLVVFGAGAIGGAVGARLHQAGFDVTLIARGDHGRAIRDRRLKFETPEGVQVLPVPVVDHPSALQWHGDEVVLLCVKSQDTVAALESLRPAAPAIVCLQNGVENERVALRLFPEVYGAVVMLPAAHLEPGVVQAYGTRLTGIVDVGRYPRGVDERAAAVAQALTASGFASEPREDVMRLKYAKLVMNLANAAGALFGAGPARDELIEAVQAEGRSVLSAAGIDFEDAAVSDLEARWERMGVGEISGRERAGSSTWQSLARRRGTIETDYLNGEIVLLGRLHSVPVPVNAALCELAARAAREGLAPGSLSAEEVLPAWSR